MLTMLQKILKRLDASECDINSDVGDKVNPAGNLE